MVLEGGLLRAPLGQSLDLRGVPLEPGAVYGCLAETMILGLAGIREHFSYGRLLPDRVRRIAQLARVHGFKIEENPDVGT